MPPGVAGELWVRGARITRGYLDDPVATAETIDADGWLHTGDLAEMDADGRLPGRRAAQGHDQDRRRERLTGRGRGTARRSTRTSTGRPSSACPTSAGASWWSPSSSRRAGRDPDPAELTEFCRNGLSPFKVPRLWRVVDDLPMTASAKVQRAELRRIAAEPLRLTRVLLRRRSVIAGTSPATLSGAPVAATTSSTVDARAPPRAARARRR